MIGQLLSKQIRGEADIARGDANTVRQRSWGEYVSIWSNLTGARAVWGMGSIDDAGHVTDMSGKGYTLINNGGTLFGTHNHAVPYAIYNGSTRYHSIPDAPGLDLLGNEAVISTPYLGVTVACWYWKSYTPSVRFGLVSKADIFSVGNDNFLVSLDPNPIFRAYNGATEVSVDGGASTNEAWHLAVARFKPGVEISIDNDGNKLTTATVLTSLTNSDRPVLVGTTLNNGSITYTLDGRIALVALIGSWVDDEYCRYLYRYGRALLP